MISYFQFNPSIADNRSSINLCLREKLTHWVLLYCLLGCEFRGNRTDKRNCLGGCARWPHANWLKPQSWDQTIESLCFHLEWDQILNSCHNQITARLQHWHFREKTLRAKSQQTRLAGEWSTVDRKTCHHGLAHAQRGPLPTLKRHHWQKYRVQSKRCFQFANRRRGHLPGSPDLL